MRFLKRGGMVLLVFLMLIAGIWIYIISCFEPWEYVPAYNEEAERKRRMSNLLKQHIYKSARFIVIGNIGIRITITDLKEDTVYEIAYMEMKKFRRHWINLNPLKKDSFLMAFILTKSGKLNQKVA